MVSKILLVGLIITIIPLIALWSNTDIYGQASTLEQKGPDTSIVMLKSHKIKEGDYSDSLIGQVQNNAGKDVTFVEVIATFYDQNGDIIGTKNTYTNPTDLRTNMKAPFEMFLDDELVDQIATYDLMIDWREPDGPGKTQVYEFTSAKAQNTQQTQEQLQSVFNNDKENEKDDN
jgi:hypothetical protein